MEKKTIGAFMATMRKSQGLTQQDVADRLHVSNRTVSKWERDESSPDIGTIPAIAELFGVSCDEILTGERFAAKDEGQQSQKAEKQMRLLSRNAVVAFKNRCLLCWALTILGLVMMYAVAAVYSAGLGFALSVIFITLSTVLAVMQFNSSSSLLKDDDWPSGEAILEQAVFRINRYLFATVFVQIGAMILSFPIFGYSGTYGRWDGTIFQEGIGSVFVFPFFLMLFICMLLAFVGVLLFHRKLGITFFENFFESNPKK